MKGAVMNHLVIEGSITLIFQDENISSEHSFFFFPHNVLNFLQ